MCVALNIACKELFLLMSFQNQLIARITWKTWPKPKRICPGQQIIPELKTFAGKLCCQEVHLEINLNTNVYFQSVTAKNENDVFEFSARPKLQIEHQCMHSKKPEENHTVKYPNTIRISPYIRVK